MAEPKIYRMPHMRTLLPLLPAVAAVVLLLPQDETPSEVAPKIQAPQVNKMVPQAEEIDEPEPAAPYVDCVEQGEQWLVMMLQTVQMVGESCKAELAELREPWESVTVQVLHLARDKYVSRCQRNTY